MGVSDSKVSKHLHTSHHRTYDIVEGQIIHHLKFHTCLPVNSYITSIRSCAYTDRILISCTKETTPCGREELSCEIEIEKRPCPRMSSTALRLIVVITVFLGVYVLVIRFNLHDVTSIRYITELRNT